MGIYELIIILGFFSIILFVVAIINILKSTFVTTKDKVIWLMIVFFVPLAGAIIYFVIGKKYKEYSQK